MQYLGIGGTLLARPLRPLPSAGSASLDGALTLGTSTAQRWRRPAQWCSAWDLIITCGGLSSYGAFHLTDLLLRISHFKFSGGGSVYGRSCA